MRPTMDWKNVQSGLKTKMTLKDFLKGFIPTKILRNSSQRLPKVQILRAAIQRIEQLQRMLYTDDQLKTLQNRVDGVVKQKNTYSKVKCSFKIFS